MGKCKYCNGLGEIREIRSSTGYKRCMPCGGTGFLRNKCHNCNGLGEIRDVRSSTGYKKCLLCGGSGYE